jgi:hypothetical protein
VTFDNRFDDIGRKVSKSQKPADIGIVELDLSGDLRRVGIFSASKSRIHDLARNDDLFSGPGPRSQQRRYVDLRRVAVFVSRGGRGRCRWLADDLKPTALNNDPLDGVGHPCAYLGSLGRRAPGRVRFKASVTCSSSSRIVDFPRFSEQREVAAFVQSLKKQCVEC